MTPWLTADELHDLTGRTRWQAQCRALAAMGVPYRPNAQGRPLVETFWTDCMVQTSDGRWVPLRNYRVIENRGPE